MSKRQASIATFLSPRQTATSSIKRAAVDASADSPAKRARRAAIRAAAEEKREDGPDVELTGGAEGSPETKRPATSMADKGKCKTDEVDLSLYNGDMKPEEAEMLAIAESAKNARAAAGHSVEATDTKEDIIELDDLDAECKPGESSRSPLLSPVVKPAATPIAKLKAGQSGTTPSHLSFMFPPPNHPSYHLPPSPTYNHPITIVPPSASLVDAMRFNTVPRSITSPADLDLLYFTKFIDPTCSRLLTKYLLDSLPWYRVNYTTKGIDIKTPRYTTVFGKDATAMPWEVYDKWKPRAIPEILLRLMQKVEEVTGETYNFTLVNYYSSGTDSISYHSDSERFLGPNPCIASISLGAPRDFMLRHVDYRTNGIPVQKFNLHDGDMVVMRGKTQHKYQHAIPKRAKAEGRINITFRKGVVKYATENYLTYNVGRGPMFRWKGGKMVQQDES